MGKKLEMKKNYLLKVAIDFGSTNTVMAWRMYEKDNNGNPKVSEKLNNVNNIIKIPSIMIFAEENPDNEDVKEDLFGEEALVVAKDANMSAIVCDNFKQLLYVNKPKTPEYQKGVQLCTKFFEHLRSVYRMQIINRFTPQQIGDMEVVLYLSTPVRANFLHHSEMRNIALNAGFTADNGITEINNDFDEATCVVRYALDCHLEKMKRVFVKAGTARGSLLLFVDAGGSTLDSCIMRLHIKDDGSIKFDPVSKWPENPDVKYPLGGCQIDEAIRDYLIKEGYADKEYTLNKWEKGDGKYRFRKFKEGNNIKVQNIGISILGNVAGACYNDEEDIKPKYYYAKSNKKINAKVYEEEICKEYIQKFRLSFKELFDNQRKTTEYDIVEPSDIDGIFLTGAGSNLYFIPRILLEDFDEKTPGFVNVRKDKDNLFFADWDDPSVCCALGALTDDRNIDMPNYAKGDYYLSLSVYSHGSRIADELENGTIKLDPKKQNIRIDGNDYSYKHIASEQFQISKKYQMLPVISTVEKNSTYIDDDLSDFLTVQIVVKQLKADGKMENIDTYNRTIKRVLSDRLKQYAKRTTGVVSMVPMIGTLIIDEVSEKFGGKGELTEKYSEFLDNTIFPDREVNMTFKAEVELSHNAICIDTKFESSYFKDGENSISIKI